LCISFFIFYFVIIFFFFFFFFQAEDGIRDLTVTGVQTCALPICSCPTAAKIASDRGSRGLSSWMAPSLRSCSTPLSNDFLFPTRSEERRVGKECRSRWSRYH